MGKVGKKKLRELQEIERGTGFIWRVRTKTRMIWAVITNRSAERKYGAKVNVEKTLKDILE